MDMVINLKEETLCSPNSVVCLQQNTLNATYMQCFVLSSCAAFLDKATNHQEEAQFLHHCNYTPLVSYTLCIPDIL